MSIKLLYIQCIKMPDLDVDQSKQNIRKNYLLIRKNTAPDNQLWANEQTVKNIRKILLPNNQNDIYGLYLPMTGEPDILQNFMEISENIALPKMLAKQMTFVKYQTGDSLEQSAFSKLKQPLSKEEIIPKTIIVPGLCFSVRGDRLGFGFGHYDKYLYKIRKFCQPITIGVCFHQNLTLSLPVDQHDQRMDYIVTDQVILKI